MDRVDCIVIGAGVIGLAVARRLALAGATAILIAPFVLGTLADRVGIGRAYGLVVPLLLSAVVLAVIGNRLAQHP